MYIDFEAFYECLRKLQHTEIDRKTKDGLTKELQTFSFVRKC